METNAHYKLPGQDACYVDASEMPKLLRAKNIPNRHGIKRMVQEGFMIRQSRIQDGKVVIPPGGLIYFENGGEYFGPLNGEPCAIAGEEAVWIDQEEALVVKKDFFLPFGGQPVPLGEDGTMAMYPFYLTDSYFGVTAGIFKYVFANGHPAWDKGIVLDKTAYGISPSKVATGYVEEEGMKTPPPLQYFGDSYSAHSATYIVVEDYGPKGAQIKEAGAPEALWFKVSYDPPIIADQLKVGQTLAVKEYAVKVLSCDKASGTARVALLDSQGKILAEKTLGPLTLDTYKVKNLIHHDMAIRESLFLDYENLKIQLNTKYDSPLIGTGPTNIIDESGKLIPADQAREIKTIQEDGVDLVVYTNIEKVFLRKPWDQDPRFVFQTHYL
ncbi:MAG: hypothetical protein JW943_06085 [Deltaproteobacteria bacterium]|nr:hypothetical protein [Deltaproteobacteria bacterium]